MASRTFAALQGGGRSTLDVPVAALAGLSVAVIAFAMPGDLLADLVGATGLPSIVSAAEPPLGFKARIGIGAAGAVIMFGFTFVLLRWLEKFGGRRAVRRQEEEELVLEVEAPRLRRRDIHPDAPARPPLLAAHELGEPDLDFDAPATDPYAAWPAPAAEAPAESIPWPDPASERAPAAELDYRESDEDAPIGSPEESDQADAFALSQQRWTDTYEPGPQPGPVVEQPWNEPASDPQIDAFDAPEQAESPVEPEPEQRIAAASPWSPPAKAADEPDQAAERPQPGSIADLMERLEQGLARRRSVPELAVDAAEPPSSSVPPADNDRLQNAIDSLQRFASRQD